MRNNQITITGILLLALFACKKEAGQPDQSSDPRQPKEEVAVTPVTPLDKAIPLPVGSHNAGRLRSAGGTKAPIVLVHGLGGFGPGELLGYHYWGGLDNIPQYMTSLGYPTYEASVGAVSSNWDRAIDLYYYIKGGYVDYGRFHSGKYGHDQKKARYYPGVYPQWDAQHPVHLLGHSMGGMTVRKLVTLLEKGDAAERQDPGHAPLFNGNKTGWVKSVTSISTPHNGATLTYIILHRYIPFVRELITTFVAFAGAGLGIENIYDFDMDHWGLERKPGESFSSYADRVAKSRAWQTEDYSGHDVTPESRRDANLVDLDSKNIYYFSFTTKASNRGFITGWEYPRLDVLPFLIPTAFPTPFIMGIGNFTQREPGKVLIDAKWWANDGAANCYGMSGPSNGIIKEYDPNAPLQKGVWNHMGVYNGQDHFDIIGINLTYVRPFYRNIATLLGSLE